tara:strand:+ start:15828 stop:16943 length:1116 start_codon:yes stop_codon:yes gene_type:complete
MSERALRRPIEVDEASSHMRRAIELAEAGRFRVMPNPMVGCVLVRDGNVIAEGWHDHLGGLHAEQMAIADAESRGIETQGATAFVTLEPCNHFGRTPPCIESLLWAGVSSVVIGSLDPNPNVRGGGARALVEAGVHVHVGVMEDECEKQMAEFMHWCRTRRPLVTMKASTDAEGRIDGNPNEPSKRFSSPESMALSHELRADSMAILVGVNTVIRDDPELTVRGPEIKPREPPIRVVVDPVGRIPNGSKVLVDGKAPTMLINSSEIDTSEDQDHVERAIIPEREIPISRILDMLGDRGIQSLLVEGGADTWGRFLSEGAVDRARVCISPTILEGDSPRFSPKALSESGLEISASEERSGDRIEWWTRKTTD